jgi:hypothetical protein
MLDIQNKAQRKKLSKWSQAIDVDTVNGSIETPGLNSEPVI